MSKPFMPGDKVKSRTFGITEYGTVASLCSDEPTCVYVYWRGYGKKLFLTSVGNLAHHTPRPRGKKAS